MWFNTIKNDIKSIMERDPAARNVIEVLICYPGLHAVVGHRLSHWLWQHHFKLMGRIVSQTTRYLTGIEIHPGASIGPGFFIDHGMGVVIGETAEVGKNVTLYHGVTLGGVSTEKGKRHPTIGDNVVIGTGAKVLGAITIGADSRIGANAVVVKSVPSNSVVVGVPGQVVMRSKPQSTELDLHHDRLPDTISASLMALMRRLDEMEKSINLHMEDHPLIITNGHSEDSYQAVKDENAYVPVSLHMPDHGIWHGEDFMI
jgi:serine O-acetyltransferase